MPTDEGMYFFLSYAHPSPLRGFEMQPDAEVLKFFTDLSRRLRAVAALREGQRVGFLDAELDPGADWDRARGRALSVAQVFVPLYSPTYFNSPGTLSELRWFRDRLAVLPPEEARPHVLPVLWDPLPPRPDSPPRTEDALAIAPDSAAYREDGMRVLSVFPMYEKEYDDVLGRIAAAINRVAHGHRLPPSPAPPPTPEPIPPDVAQFVVVVAAPTRDAPPPGREEAGYGRDAAHWQPFGAEGPLPAADYAASIAEQLRLATYVTDLDGVNDLLDTRPAIVLIDPWILAAGQGERALGGALRRLPGWAIPVIITDELGRNDARAVALAERVEAMLQAMDRPRPKRLHGLQEFRSGVRDLISEARRRYFKDAPGIPSGRTPSPRLRLMAEDRPPEPTF
ncbi:TIR-like protein FxsC [Dactylosporangium salmoneum]|uniref:TIR domain-containing protein n=1 Tax=Dactylosporangium salmoneum TaxID=53361 RepID=A0ABP5TX61_9ACTN